MFLLLGVLFLILGTLLLISFKKKKASYFSKIEKLTQNNNTDKKHKKHKNKADKLKEKSELELKKDKVNAYSFIVAGICCIIVEITMKFL